ncbi:MAG: ROK family protein [Bauldia sp.]|uniref:ROK family protein n=1 Tax=Bauldia sp. TaxID=2575872 RepID=UPI001D5B6AB1|nr:ROK family protein [Bauldia sp.]MCB1497759.1 ROK family protein [Bauldia sp.]
MSRVLAIDLGGTRLRAALADAVGPVDIEELGSWPAPEGLDAFAAKLGALRAEAGPVAGLGIAVPGLVEGSRCRWIPNLPWLDGVDLAELVPDLTVAVGNDAQFALVAEAAHGAAAMLRNAVLLAVGTGIGSAVLAEGRIVRGAHGGACSYGWATADPDDAGEDRSGWLERAAAGRALDALAGELGLADGAALMQAARNGNAAALEALDGPAAALGAAIASAVALLDPEAVLLAGGVAEAADVLVPKIRAAASRHLPRHLRDPEIRVGTFGSRAGIVGAAVAGAAGREWWRIR